MTELKLSTWTIRLGWWSTSVRDAYAVVPVAERIVPLGKLLPDRRLSRPLEIAIFGLLPASVLPTKVLLSA